jgi:large subunit ribosomal protein L15
MKLNEIRDNEGAAKERTRIGRGIGSGKGKQGGRGGKGQTARSGYRNKGFEGGQMPLHRRLPKRGFTPPNARDLNEVNLGRIQEAVDAGKLDPKGLITVDALVTAGVLSKPRDGVKVLGTGELKARLAFEVAGASKSAVEAIERAGGPAAMRALDKLSRSEDARLAAMARAARSRLAAGK